MNAAIIPARGGSKRIPRKNIRSFGGKPMIAWSIEAAIESDCFDHVIVSTDDSEIAEIAIQYGAAVPFMRPSVLSDDYTGTIPVIRHAIHWLQSNQLDVDYACCIYATAPFVCAEDIRRGLALLKASGADYAFSVASYVFPVQRAIRLADNGRVKMAYPEHFDTRSQDLEDMYHDAGQFYWGKVDAWLNERVIFSQGSVPVPLPRHRVQDIDTQEDWERAEWMLKAKLAQAGVNQ
ncbi:pseudaminic acid cytidylyltransferase [Microbulbifer elongatus]|uniref:pseudaminic acid cytidylyltransferase n=1 Tax=Microbulbifer elongatus TaxID=86173 RepID=UPI001E63FAA3|nr:pseudaminic acid cytidylyltransferase [Microbulbifer elongatus]